MCVLKGRMHDHDSIIIRKIKGLIKVMKQIITRKSKNITLLIAALTFISIVNMLSFVDIINWGFSLAPLIKLNLIIMAFICSAGMIIFIFRKKHYANFIIFLFIFFSIISTLLNYNLQGGNILNSIIYQMLWGSVFILIFYEAKRQNDLIIVKNILYTFPIIFSLFIYLYIQYDLIMNVKGFNLVYYVLVFLPFILCMRRHLLKKTCILMVIFAVLLSVKRLAIIALILALIVYLIINYYVTGNRKNGKVFYRFIAGGVFLVIALFIYNYTTQIVDLDVIARLNTLSSDGGSGRNSIYQGVWNKQLNSSLVEWIFGRGYYAVSLTSAAGHYFNISAAHNDFLEVLYDYGLIGFSLYITFWWIIINHNIKLIKYKSEKAAPFAASLVIFLFLSMFSVLILYPRYFLYLIVFWAMCFAENKKSTSKYGTTKY